MIDHEPDPLDCMAAQVMNLRAELIARDTRIDQLEAQLHELEAAVPGLRTRHQLARESERQIERIQSLDRALQKARLDAERQQQRADGLAAELAARAVAPSVEAAAPVVDATRLDDRAVLCVGGRPAAVPLYRHLVEKLGARFLHHDGGEDSRSASLDATLVAADLVICQTGCISHHAYWRVRDHCKRTGKRCVVIETPSSAGIRRALGELA